MLGGSSASAQKSGLARVWVLCLGFQANTRGQALRLGNRERARAF
jgi:hypothetical protein